MTPTASSTIEASTRWASGTGGVAGKAEVGGDELGGGQIEPVGEDREVPEQSLLVVGQQVVGPLDRLAARSTVVAVAEQVEGTVEPVVKVGEAER